MLNDSAAAEDATQEVFLRVLEKLDSFKGESSPVSWIYRIATNICIDELRRESRRPSVRLGEDLEAVLVSESPDAERTISKRRELDEIFKNADSLSLQIFIHTCWDEMGQQEIAELLGVSRKTVWTKLDNLRKRFGVGAQ